MAKMWICPGLSVVGNCTLWIVWPDGTAHEEADGFLQLSDGTGTQRTYAYHLVDHLRWRKREGLSTESVLRCV